MALEDAIDGGARERYKHRDLGVAHAQATQGADATFERTGGAFGLAVRDAGEVSKSIRNTFGEVAFDPSADSFFIHTPGRCCGPACESVDQD